jgi:hypothetical protein
MPTSMVSNEVAGRLDDPRWTGVQLTGTLHEGDAGLPLTSSSHSERRGRSFRTFPFVRTVPRKPTHSLSCLNVIQIFTLDLNL